ncbi:transcription repressor NadR [Niallia endozanthoxylica]|uniref:Transcription repressor NadR n=1 Tax=Niallia endozanthoxylica TaxID=2036016 RepID=A0A5J5HH63_9BACI|nr:transcription repressor NadR [Niallia endozanthoxylica]KAA9019497.1 transcription repressor NadR [Niallia endozanthoxylica]
MKVEAKMSSTKRQQLIIDKLENTNTPITGSEFAKMANVSRQVIVQDISLLKAKNIPIMSTSQGYILNNNKEKEHNYEAVIICNHSLNQIEEELFILVGHGVTVKDIMIKHAVYGELKASVMVSNQSEVEQFMKRIKDANAVSLSSLTDGIHYHTLEADSKEKIEAAFRELKKAGILVNYLNQ